MDFHLDAIKMGDVLQYRSEGGFFSDRIVKEQMRRGFSRVEAQYTHVEISGGEQHSVNIAPPRARPVEITKAHAGRYIRVWRPKLYDTDTTDRKRLKVAYISACQSNLGYDWWGVVKFRLPWMFHKSKEFFCSEGCCLSIRHQFPIFLAPHAAHEVLPAHYGDPTHSTLIFEGRIPE